MLKTDAQAAAADAWNRGLADAPVPGLLSDEAREMWRAGVPMPEAEAADLAEQRQICDRMQAEIGSRQLSRYAVDMHTGSIAGVPVRIFRPHSAQSSPQSILINCHGGAFMKDSGSITENVPVAAMTGHTVIAVLYRLAPEHVFPAAVDDIEAVYRDLLRSTPPEQLGLYGTSAGAILAGQALVRFAAMGLPMPARLGFFSGAADFTTAGDSEWFFPLIDDPRPVRSILAPYLGQADTGSAAVSPAHADLAGFPPTLCITATRDLMLSQTSSFHRALAQAGVDARLVVFEAMPHAHWSYLELPESDQAFAHMARHLALR